MRRKPIRIDWEELETAFENKDAELAYYVDRVTGRVLLEGEGQDSEEEERFDARPIAPLRPPRSDGLRAYVVPPGDERKLDWVRRFTVEQEDLEPEFKELLVDALSTDDPIEAVIDVLDQFPEGKDLWYFYRADRLHEAIEEWLNEAGIEATNPPPWKS